MKKTILVLLFFSFYSLNAQVFKVNKVTSSIFIGTAAVLQQSAGLVNDEFYEQLSENDIFDLNENSIPFFDRWSITRYDENLDKISDYLVFASLGASMYISYDEPYTLDNLIVLSKIALTQSALASWSKALTQRNRPYVYDDGTNLDIKQKEDAQQSFFSHHTSTIFSLATYSYFYSYQLYGSKPLLAVGLYGSAAICASLRVASGNHFPSDVITGAVVGSAVSYLICKQHNKNAKLKLNLKYNHIGFCYNF
ncbi:MAG: phosphatase PAP2 family protein [Candidatus Cloacimonadota bacterium]|nr:phosphatase PAP2 family protein [Candidatus Cloacimonadota bacterium]